MGTSPSRSSTTSGSHAGSTNSPVWSVVKIDMRSSLSLSIERSSDTVICGIRCSTATSASAIFAAKVSRASFRSSFFTASCAAILTSYTSSSSYISFT